MGEDNTTCWCTFGDSIEARPQLVNLDGIRPIEEVNLQQGIIPMKKSMLKLYSLLTDVELHSTLDRKSTIDILPIHRIQPTVGLHRMDETCVLPNLHRYPHQNSRPSHKQLELMVPHRWVHRT